MMTNLDYMTSSLGLDIVFSTGVSHAGSSLRGSSNFSVDLSDTSLIWAVFPPDVFDLVIHELFSTCALLQLFFGIGSFKRFS